ncbi:hypothetical protein LMH87_000320 [Akanthomyces muscarius]|uniref:Zn(2)-C6 fungal-type domain-containing protein n=1 Tax=Akanthomyces muscarius TaxID=2231603 RepID=A0A9W8QEA9_AKAMU|nr:hypothetical protein LMH87_000320 [Akanthomyces muscarius]KAJ4155054.1 hypothetical protein LMH87_000320 [Akanthomyces muscarius]
MRLKRGVERESCDFCHGRKIKCDKTALAAKGISVCSACQRRSIPCVVDDSNDIRLRRRKLLQHGEAESSSQASIEPASKFGLSCGQTLPTTTDASVSLADEQDSLFDLNPDSILFLDHIFMGDLGTNLMGEYQTGFNMDFSTFDTTQTSSATAPGLEHYQDLWSGCGMSEGDFMGAIRGYFEYAALCLPIIFEDAFWKDVQSKAASAAFVCAIACRGMPFTEHVQKWNLQNQLASRFKLLFLQNQQSSQQSPSLDHIEALTLMFGFPYEEGSVGGLESLFLSKDALVLMTLQLRTSKRESTLSRASERLTLLFWHVYGVDAFTSLDHKTASRIPDADANRVLSGTGSGYLDTMLSLALVARKILQRLCEASRVGIQYADVEFLYGLLDEWQMSSCPPGLRQPCGGGEGDDAVNQHLHLQRVVLHLLHVNCTLQIESWVDEHGIKIETLVDEMTASRVAFESLHALAKGVEMARWLDDCHFGKFAIADLAPNVVRDIFIGLGSWMCLRGHRLSESFKYRIAEDSTVKPKDLHLQAVAVLRSAAAKAVSHRDTTVVLGRLDGLIAS